MKLCTTLALIAIMAVCGAASLYADWTEIRDLVRQGDGLTSESKQEEIYRRAYAAALKSVAAHPNTSNEHLWLAIAAGRLGLISSIKERIQLSKVVKDNAERAIALDAKNGQAYMVLGAWHFYVADLSWVQKNAAKMFYGGLPPASYQQAVSNLTKAVQLGVDNPVECYYLRGRAYEELDNEASAHADYKRCAEAKGRNEKEQGMQADARDRMD
jgi:tetratricopeptide (TPR) repeat protein